MVILALWNEKNTPPMASQELRQALQSIAKAEAAKPASVGVMPAEYFLEAEIDRPNVIISDSLLFEGGAMMVTGASGVGKSLLTLEMAVSISKGIPWLYHEVAGPYQVLFVQTENPKHALQSRLRRICRGLGVNHLPKVHFVDRKFRCDINQERDRRQLIDLIDKTKAQVIILDPLESFHQANENDNIAMRRTLDHFTNISAQTKVAWIVVHHEGKPGQDAKENHWRYRGASSIRNWADTMIGLIRQPHESRVLRTLSFDKIRFGREKLALLLERDENFCHQVTDEDSRVPLSLVADALSELGGIAKSKAELSKVIGKYVDRVSRATIYRAIDYAENRIWVEVDNGLKLIGKY